MRNTTLASIVIAVGLPFGLRGQVTPPPPRPSVAELARSVVVIEVDLLNGTSSGSGVIVDPNGVIATAAHVVAGARAARVRFGSGDVLKVEGLIDADPDLDFALIRVAGFQLPAATLGNSDSLVLGQRLLAIGAPIGLEATVTDGLLSAVRNDGNRRLLQISIPVSHGSSGGPVFDEQGRVVGLVVSGIRPDVAENLNFALPINYVRGKLALAASKTPVPLAQSAIQVPSAASLPGQSGTGGVTGPDAVNTDLHLEWRSLKGVEAFSEYKGENGLREVSLTQYEVTTDPFGAPLLVRHLTARVRKVATFRIDRVADDALVTELSLGPEPRLHERGERTSYAANWPGGVVDVLIDGRQFSYTPFKGPTQTGTVPQGTLTGQLVNGAIAALPDSLPGTAFIWAFDLTTGRAEAVRAEFGRRQVMKVPLLGGSQSCGPDAITKDTAVSVVWVTVTRGTAHYQTPVLASRPHVNVDPNDIKCVRRPGWGGVPRP